MKFWYHILVAFALLIGLLPCGHAGLHHDHDHHSAMELCALASDPCECHSCDHQPCSEQPGAQRIQVAASATVQPPSSPDLLFVLPETISVIRPSRPPVSGMLAVLQTIQLLI